VLQSKVAANSMNTGSNNSSNSNSSGGGNIINIGNSNRSATGKSPRALSVFSGSETSAATGSSTSQVDQVTARGEADGSPAPLPGFPYSLDSAAAGSETATPASSVTPSMTSPTSPSTTSPSPQPPLRGLAEGRRTNKDYSDSLISHRSQMGGGPERGSMGAALVGLQLATRGSPRKDGRGDDTDPGESDLDSPNQ